MEVRCLRCRRIAPGLPEPPFSGPLGVLIHERTCARCWRDWAGLIDKIMNEYRLSFANPQHVEAAFEQMRRFLQLPREVVAVG